MPGSPKQDYLVVYVTTAGAGVAAGLARTLVEERLAACGSVVAPVRSIYRWAGKIEDETEALLVLKTRAELFEDLKRRVLELHAYEVPEVIALPIVEGHRAYLEWIASNTRDSKPTGGLAG